MCILWSSRTCDDHLPTSRNTLSRRRRSYLLSLGLSPLCVVDHERVLQTLPKGCEEDGCTNLIKYEDPPRCLVYGYRTGARSQFWHSRKSLQLPREFGNQLEKMIESDLMNIDALDHHQGRLKEWKAQLFTKMVLSA